MSNDGSQKPRGIIDPTAEQMAEAGLGQGSAVVDEGTEIMDAEPDPAADLAGSPSSAPERALDPDGDPIVGETRRMRADEVAKAALPFEQKLGAAAPPERAGTVDEDGVEVPEAMTEAVRATDLNKSALPFTASQPPSAPAADPDALDEVVWRSRVGIDPNDLPSAQLVVPNEDDDDEVAGSAPAAERGNWLPVALLLCALLVGFAVVALLAR